ncbi:hypothetical protein E2C01_093275 [Portunus trituberculatus]|uniref:Uncharacterized protein n=1 Tax=Portunus trituberculatus TaxID=210409 RepID=A0A5B7JMB4_PORTR|nr:hypothetical protein [Portunus trituberculatus]
MMQVVLRELGHKRVEMTGREWMVVLLGLCGDTDERMIETVKEFLERMRCRYKGLTQKKLSHVALRSRSRYKGLFFLCAFFCRLQELPIQRPGSGVIPSRLQYQDQDQDKKKFCVTCSIKIKINNHNNKATQGIMAEFVEFRIEETIPEVEEMERLGILASKEVK